MTLSSINDFSRVHTLDDNDDKKIKRADSLVTWKR